MQNTDLKKTKTDVSFLTIILQNASDLCYNLAMDQLDNLLINMENTVLNPLNGSHTRFKQVRFCVWWWFGVLVCKRFHIGKHSEETQKQT